MGGRKGIRPVKTEWWGAGVVISLERGADLHMAQLMPLPLTISCSSKIQIGFTFLVSADLGSPGQRAFKRVCVCVCGSFMRQSASFPLSRRACRETCKWLMTYRLSARDVACWVCMRFTAASRERSNTLACSDGSITLHCRPACPAAYVHVLVMGKLDTNRYRE